MERTAPDGAFEAAFPRLTAVGLGVVDVGARGGLQRAFDEVAPYVRGIGFEADVEECAALDRAARDTSYRSLSYLPFALGGQAGRATLHLCRSRGVSSLRAPNKAFLSRFPDASRFTVERVVEVDLVPLDDLTRSPEPRIQQPIDFLKIDAQGAELDILRGASRTLGSIVALEVEVEFAPIYTDQPLFRHLDESISEQGFTLFKLRRMEWVRGSVQGRWRSSAGQLIHGDALYLRDPLDAAARWRPSDARQAEALILLACLYDLHDFALEIISSDPVAAMIDVDAVRRFVTRRSRAVNDPMRHVRSPFDTVRAILRPLLRGTPLRDPRRHWARGDGDFYSRL